MAACLLNALELSEAETTTTPGLKHAEVRKLLHEVINELLRLGGRPDSAIAEETDGGEIIDVKTRGPNGDLYTGMNISCLGRGERKNAPVTAILHSKWLVMYSSK